MLQKLKGKELSRNITDYLLENGAISVGFSTKETLRDSPPSADITYLMESGLSAISFAVPMNKEHIRLYLAKEDRLAHMHDEIAAALSARKLGHELTEMIRGEGSEAIRPSINLKGAEQRRPTV